MSSPENFCLLARSKILHHVHLCVRCLYVRAVFSFQKNVKKIYLYHNVYLNVRTRRVSRVFGLFLRYDGNFGKKKIFQTTPCSRGTVQTTFSLRSCNVNGLPTWNAFKQMLFSFGNPVALTFTLKSKSVM